MIGLPGHRKAIIVDCNNEMSLTKDLSQKPASLSTGSTYTAMNGVFYLGFGALLISWPGVTQTIFADRAFVGHEEALIRVMGMAVAVIGWLYLFGGRSGARQIIAASVVDRLVLVPAVLVPPGDGRRVSSFADHVRALSTPCSALGRGCFSMPRRDSARCFGTPRKHLDPLRRPGRDDLVRHGHAAACAAERGGESMLTRVAIGP
ncbi:MAG: hypothetical protein MZW92_10850 [Comamonadaceae bacterium]|nr:hypothetical protein [Comamonadaceae bacterium]